MPLIKRPLLPGNENGTLCVGEPSLFRAAHAEITEGANGYYQLARFQDWLVKHDGHIPNTWQYPYQPITELESGISPLSSIAVRALCSHPDDQVRTTLIHKEVVGVTGLAIVWDHPEFESVDPTLAIIVQTRLRQKRYGMGSRFDLTEGYKERAFLQGRYPFADSLAHLRIDPSIVIRQ